MSVDMSKVKNPQHYARLTPQPKDVIRSWGLNFNLGSAVKYVARAGHKDDIVQDLKKAQEFIQFEIDAIMEERAKADEPVAEDTKVKDTLEEKVNEFLKEHKATAEIIRAESGVMVNIHSEEMLKPELINRINDFIIKAVEEER